MAAPKRRRLRRTAQFYRDNPESYKKKLAYDKKYNAKPSERRDRARHNAERRRRKIYGKGGKDVSRKKDGSFTLEDPSTNRARNRDRK